MTRVRGDYQADFEKLSIPLTSFYSCFNASDGADVVRFKLRVHNCQTSNEFHPAESWKRVPSRRFTTVAANINGNKKNKSFTPRWHTDIPRGCVTSFRASDKSHANACNNHEIIVRQEDWYGTVLRKNKFPSLTSTYCMIVCLLIQFLDRCSGNVTKQICIHVHQLSKWMSWQYRILACGQRFVGSPLGKHCKFLERNVERKVVSTSKKPYFGES